MRWLRKPCLAPISAQSALCSACEFITFGLSTHVVFWSAGSASPTHNCMLVAMSQWQGKLMFQFSLSLSSVFDMVWWFWLADATTPDFEVADDAKVNKISFDAQSIAICRFVYTRFHSHFGHNYAIPDLPRSQHLDRRCAHTRGFGVVTGCESRPRILGSDLRKMLLAR